MSKKAELTVRLPNVAFAIWLREHGITESAKASKYRGISDALAKSMLAAEPFTILQKDRFTDFVTYVGNPDYDYQKKYSLSDTLEPCGIAFEDAPNGHGRKHFIIADQGKLLTYLTQNQDLIQSAFGIPLKSIQAVLIGKSPHKIKNQPSLIDHVVFSESVLRYDYREHGRTSPRYQLTM